MAELKALVCERCGGTIDWKTMRCLYCDTQYEKKYQGMPINYVVERPGVHRIRAEVKVSDELKSRHPELATKATMERLRQGIADGLLDYMRCETSVDPMNMCHIIRGEVRVIDPTFEY